MATPEKPTKTWDKSAKWPEELELIKSIIARTELTETTKWGGPTYTLNNKNVIGIGGFNDFVTIWFWKGVFLKDKADKLINANEGVTRGLRQWRFTSIDEIRENENLIYQYLLEAIENEKNGLSIKPEKKVTVVPDYFTEILDSDLALKSAFESLTPFKQREYIEHLESAKREETRKNRIDKILPMIREGKGLQDKYR